MTTWEEVFHSSGNPSRYMDISYSHIRAGTIGDWQKKKWIAVKPIKIGLSPLANQMLYTYQYLMAIRNNLWK